MDLLDLSGPALLRLLVEVNLSTLAGWCPRCRTWAMKEAVGTVDLRCPRCGRARLPLDDAFWRWASNRIKRALRQDNALLARVKAEWEAMNQGHPLYQSEWYPNLPSRAWLPRVKPLSLLTPPTPLAWLPLLWERTGKPSGRPLKTATYYRLAYLVQVFRDLGLELEEMLDVLDYEPEEEEFPVKVRGRDYGHIPPEELRKYSALFQDLIGPAPNRTELRRILAWVQRQRANPEARLRGERVKGTTIRDGKTGALARKVPKAIPRPTTHDQIRFLIVSLLVRQEGWSQSQAIHRMAEREACDQHTGEITGEEIAMQQHEIVRSLERVERYASALANQSALPGPAPQVDWQRYWQPGVLRDRLARLMQENPKPTKPEEGLD